MNATPQPFDLAQSTMLPPLGEEERAFAFSRGTDGLENRWKALHEAADAIAKLAQLGSEPAGGEVVSLPERAAQAGGWRLEAIERGVADLTAVMQTGLRALLAATANGRDTTAAAVTLWREFHHGRAAVLAFLGTDAGENKLPDT